MNPHFKALEAAHQLHYYLCFKTRYLQPLLATGNAQQLVCETVDDVCAREEYHLLESKLTSDHLRLLVSLQPNQTISRVVQMLKGNTQHQFSSSLSDELTRYRVRNLWARGYFARSSGKVSLDVVRDYVSGQVVHHGYEGKWTEALEYVNSAFHSPAFEVAHSVCMLDYHIVLVTQQRIPIFDDFIALKLFDYVQAIGRKHRFAVDRVSVLPDHVHLIIEGVPTVSVERYVLAILDNTRYWMTKRFDGVLKETGAWNVWQPSYYAGTVGEYTTAQVKKFLDNRD